MKLILLLKIVRVIDFGRPKAFLSDTTGIYEMVFRTSRRTATVLSLFNGVFDSTTLPTKSLHLLRPAIYPTLLCLCHFQ